MRIDIMNIKVLSLSIFMLLISSPILCLAETLDKQAALKQALQNNPSYKAALSQIEAAAGERSQASLLPNPKTVFEIENIGGSGERKGFERTEITLGLEQKIELAGKRRLRTEVADYGYKINQEEAVAQALKLLSETEFTFIRMAVAKQRIVIADNSLQLANQTYEIVKERVDAAASPDYQLEKVNIEKTEAKIEKHHVEEEYIFARNDLARLLGLKSSDDLDIYVDLSVLPKLIDLAKATGVPDPTVGLGVRQFTDNDDTALVALLSFPLPLFDRNQGAIQSARANVIRTDAQAHAIELSLYQSATQAWEIFSAELEIIHHYQNDIIPSATASYNQLNKGYNLGAFSFLDLLDAQRTLNRVQSEYLDNMLELYEAKVQIDFLTGTYKPLIQEVSQHNGEEER